MPTWEFRVFSMFFGACHIWWHPLLKSCEPHSEWLLSTNHPFWRLVDQLIHHINSNAPLATNTNFIIVGLYCKFFGFELKIHPSSHTQITYSKQQKHQGGYMDGCVGPALGFCVGTTRTMSRSTRQSGADARSTQLKNHTTINHVVTLEGKTRNK